MEIIMMGNIKKIRKMVKVKKFLIMEIIIMKENGKKVKEKEKVFYLKTIFISKENSKMERKKALLKNLTLIEIL